jgi:hypothetical protein
MAKRYNHAKCGMCYFCERGMKCRTPLITDEKQHIHRKYNEESDIVEFYNDLGKEFLSKVTGN